MKALSLALSMLRALVVAAPTFAQEPIPARPVTIIVPFPPGGGTDTGARWIAQKLSERWGCSVIVENKPGAAGMIGADLASRAKPDGYTLLMGNAQTQAVNPALQKNLPYNSEPRSCPLAWSRNCRWFCS
jgi:tripartite-type tricarboxylate transporter receptor subunit TctC